MFCEFLLGSPTKFEIATEFKRQRVKFYSLESLGELHYLMALLCQAGDISVRVGQDV